MTHTMQPTESRLQGLCFQWHWNTFPHYRGLLHRNNNTAQNAIKGALNRSMGIVKGVADLEYFFASTGHFIELKSQEGIQTCPAIGGSEEQKLFQARIEEQGGYYHIIRSYDEFKQLITAIPTGHHR
ncbi:hypothetical protein [Xanthocytophaga agilis]|uniref:VRR-NUC domain-containing protein n=1 Tax=Xanthocytophaga agilis TaxID=3048010 RepID=A0AAE3UKA0_9BACT|nr:hypothetical protein [Xanthocytophaga agilis]MDJ1506763.1 hypothetical protein [Xanthocytophaga agilis]